MTITSKFFTGYVNNIDWANHVRAVGYRYMVDGNTDFKVSTNGAVARGYSVAAGSASGGGVRTISDAVESGASYALPFNAAERWHLIGIDRTWGGTNTSVITSIIGSSSKAIPTRPSTPGVEDFQPLALARVAAGGSSIVELIDLRAIGNNSGLLVVFDALAKDYLNQPGTKLYHDRTMANGGPMQYERIVDASNAVVWLDSKIGDSGWITLSTVNGWTTVLGASVRVRRMGNYVHLQGRVTKNAGTERTFANLPTGFIPPADIYIIGYAPSPDAAARTIIVRATGELDAPSPPAEVILMTGWLID
jgi:hypothetical protein